MDRAQTDGVQDGGQVRREEVGLARGLGREDPPDDTATYTGRSASTPSLPVGMCVKVRFARTTWSIQAGAEGTVVVHGRADDQAVGGFQLAYQVSESASEPRARSAAAPGVPSARA